MGKTVPSYRIALEMEIAGWNGFKEKLSPFQQDAFDQLMDMCRSHASASGNACNPIIFEPMALSILLETQKELRKLKSELAALPRNQEQRGEANDR